MSKVFKITYPVEGKNYQKLISPSSLNIESGRLEISENDYEDLIALPNVNIKGLFKTTTGNIIECSAIPQHPLTFRLTSDITSSLIRPRITQLDKSDLDKKNTFRALIVDQDGNPIKGARSIRSGLPRYHLYDKYVSLEDFSNKRLEGNKKFASSSGPVSYTHLTLPTILLV